MDEIIEQYGEFLDWGKGMGTENEQNEENAENKEENSNEEADNVQKEVEVDNKELAEEIKQINVVKPEYALFSDVNFWKPQIQLDIDEVMKLL